MGDKTAIEWCDATFNPWWGCTRISPACDHCYADAFARRVGFKVWDNDQRRTFGDKHWDEPLKWARTKPAKLGRRPRVFCASMADVFDKDAPEGQRERLWKLIAATPELDWLLLTKRIGNVARMVPVGWGLPENVWLGATVANQEEADRDIPKLLATPAHIRFLSCEPLLGPISFEGLFASPGEPRDGTNALEMLDWIISGGESGPKARPSHPDWHRALRDQCRAAGVPFLFKQWGEYVWREAWGDSTGRKHIFDDGVFVNRVGKEAAGRMLDGRTHDGYPHA